MLNFAVASFIDMSCERYIKVLLAVLAIVCCAGSATAQIVANQRETINADSLRRDFDNQPYFGLYKDNYFIFGPAIGQKITKENTNIKFQISIAQRLTRSTLPLGTYLYLFYTQKVFWNVLENSMPMTDLNFNPGIGLAKPLFVKNRFIGKVILCLEHESNGRDGDASRSWNKISLGANILIDPMLMVHGKVWIPIVDGQNNRDILDYSGIYQVGLQAFSSNRRFNCSVTLTKRRGWNLNYNTVVEFAYRLWKRDNQFLFMQYYNGFGEGLLEYNKFHSQLRVGIVIKPRLFSDF
ncbi:MAG: phospholipase A [Bacteroidales bacterium]|nr:phospholipase A [Bacteroidales bacterium]